MNMYFFYHFQIIYIMEVHVNYWAVLVAAIANYIIATIWYALLFSKTWKKATGMSEMKTSAGNMLLTFIGSLFLSYVLYHATLFGNTYLNTSGVSGGLMCGFFNWLGFIAPITLTTKIYEKKSWTLWILDNSFWLISLLIMGSILSAWM
jgi:hypothetical protein